MISVFAMVVLGILCPQMSLAKSIDHADCSDSKMVHISAGETHDWCVNAHLKAIVDLPTVLPEVMSLVISLIAIFAIYVFQKSIKDTLTNISNLLRSRWRLSLNIFETTIKPQFRETFFAWLDFVARSSIAVKA